MSKIFNSLKEQFRISQTIPYWKLPKYMKIQYWNNLIDFLTSKLPNIVNTEKKIKFLKELKIIEGIIKQLKKQ